MSKEKPETANAPKAKPYDVIDPNYSGIDPERPIQYRNPKNARRAGQSKQYADNVDFDLD